jgi:hypothetical protein
MSARLGVIRAGEQSARAIAAHSRGALDRPLTAPAELWVAVASDEAVLVGAFQRGVGMPAAWRLLRRGSGGPEVHVGPGTVHVALALAHPAVLAPCDEKRIVNRAVRPLLRALSKTGSLAHFFGRDWVSVEHRPVGWVGFAHVAGSRRTLFEGYVGVRSPFALTQRPSFLGKTVATLDSLRKRPPDAGDARRLADAIVEAYVAQAPGADAIALPAVAPPQDPAELALQADDPRADPPWTATGEEAIGTIGAGPDARGTFRVGGDLLVSRDALAQLEARAASSPAADLARIVDETLAAPGVALDGVKSLASVRDVIVRARAGAAAAAQG